MDLSACWRLERLTMRGFFRRRCRSRCTCSNVEGGFPSNSNYERLLVRKRFFRQDGGFDKRLTDKMRFRLRFDGNEIVQMFFFQTILQRLLDCLRFFRN